MSFSRVFNRALHNSIEIYFILGISFPFALAFFKESCYTCGMDKRNNKKEYFSAKLPVAVIIACIIVALLGGTGLVLSLYRLFAFKIRSNFDVVKDVILLPVCAFCIGAPVAIIARSGYTVTEKYLYQHFGFFRTRYEISEFNSMLLQTDSGKLTIYFHNQAVAVLIASDKNEAFTRAILAVNPNIEYGFTLTDNPKNEQK